MKYVAVIEPTGTGFSAYLPDLPGCVTTGRTRDEIVRNLDEAVRGHVASLREYGDRVPEPSAQTAVVEVA